MRTVAEGAPSLAVGYLAGLPRRLWHSQEGMSLGEWACGITGPSCLDQSTHAASIERSRGEGQEPGLSSL